MRRRAGLGSLTNQLADNSGPGSRMTLTGRTFDEISTHTLLGRRSGYRAGYLDVARLGPMAGVRQSAPSVLACHSLSQGYYRAASGDCVHRPVCGVSSPPQGATALCTTGATHSARTPTWTRRAAGMRAQNRCSTEPRLTANDVPSTRF